jgi:hypothetical protein
MARTRPVAHGDRSAGPIPWTSPSGADRATAIRCRYVLEVFATRRGGGHLGDAVFTFGTELTG